MTDTEILNSLTDIFRDVFDDESVMISPESSAQDYAAWDSLSNVNILVAAELRFGVRIKTSEVEELKNVGELVALIRRKLDAQA